MERSAWIGVNWSVNDDDGGGGGANGSAGVPVAAGDPVQPLFADYPDELLHFAAGACVLFTLLGVPGNFITIVALLRYTKVGKR